MPVVALVLFAVFAVLGFGWRSWLQSRRTGSTGFRGVSVSPGLHWSEVPAEARHLVVLMDDVDVPVPKPLIHTVALIEPDRTSLGEGELVRGTAGVRIIATRLSRDGYSGPRPMPGHGPHRYRFHVLAVDRRVPDDVTSGKASMQAIAGQVIARGALTGTYER